MRRLRAQQRLPARGPTGAAPRPVSPACTQGGQHHFTAPHSLSPHYRNWRG
jgi:hypothetical protein